MLGHERNRAVSGLETALDDGSTNGDDPDGSDGSDDGDGVTEVHRERFYFESDGS